MKNKSYRALGLALGLAFAALTLFTYITTAAELSPPYVIVLRPWSENARAVAVNPNKGYAYVVANKGVAIFEAETLTLTTAPIDINSPNKVAVDTERGYVYVTRVGNRVTVLSETHILGHVEVDGTESDAVAVMTTTGYAYAALPNNDAVAILRGQEASIKVAVGSNPVAIATNPNTGYVYVVNRDSHSVSVLSGTTQIQTVMVGLTPTAVTVNPVNGYVYVSNGNNTLSILQGTTVTATLSINEPGEVAVNVKTGRVYVLANDTTGTEKQGWLEIVEGETLLGVAIPMPAEVRSIDVNPESGYVYVSNGSGSQGAVTILSDVVKLETFPMGQTPLDITVDSHYDRAYVPIYDGRVAIFGRSPVFASEPLSPSTSSVVTVKCLNTYQTPHLPITITIPPGAVQKDNTRVMCIPLQDVDGEGYTWAEQGFRLAVSEEPTGTNPPDYVFNHPLTVEVGYHSQLPGHIKEDELEFLGRIWVGLQDRWVWQGEGIHWIGQALTHNFITVSLDGTGEYALLWKARVYLPLVLKQ